MISGTHASRHAKRSSMRRLKMPRAADAAHENADRLFFTHRNLARSAPHFMPE